MPQSIPQTKVCTKCNMEYPLTLEHFRVRQNGKIDSWCRSCNRIANRLWREANPDKKRASDNNWQNNNPDKVAQRTRKYRRKNQSRYRDYAQRRRAKKKDLPHTLTSAEWENILADYGYQCAYCPKTWLDCKLTQDHVTPVDQGGGYVASNIVPACQSCNSRKHNRTPEQAGMTLRQITMLYLEASNSQESNE